MVTQQSDAVTESWKDMHIKYFLHDLHSDMYNLNLYQEQLCGKADCRAM
jgi:hypothetical protein